MRFLELMTIRDLVEDFEEHRGGREEGEGGRGERKEIVKSFRISRR